MFCCNKYLVILSYTALASSFKYKIWDIKIKCIKFHVASLVLSQVFKKNSHLTMFGICCFETLLFVFSKFLESLTKSDMK